MLVAECYLYFLDQQRTERILLHTNHTGLLRVSADTVNVPVRKWIQVANHSLPLLLHEVTFSQGPV